MRRTLTTAAFLALLGSGALAQTPAPASQPAAAKDVLDEMLKPAAGGRAKPLQPVTGAPVQDKTTLNPVAPGARPLPLKREGGYVVDRTGRVTKAADSKSVEFNFEADANSMQDPPMVLLPNLALMMMQDQLRLSGRDLRFRVTGMVTEYMGRNYLLLQKVVVVGE
ncbi:MAG TPA: hypothetical protein VF595_02155 [Tepidisphaeraceae bacterium]|jgi:hypothetical protein